MQRFAMGGRAPILLGTLVLAACTGEIASPGAPPSADSTTTTSTATSGAATGTPAPTGEPSTTGTQPSGSTGVQDGGGGGEAITGASCTDAGNDTGANVLRRLSRTEYQLTLQDLLQLPQAPDVDAIGPDVAQNGFTAYADVHTLSAVLLRNYLQVAQEQADLLLLDTARSQQVIGCDVEQAGCLQSFVSQFGELAYRRPLDADEVTSLVNKAEQAALNVEDQFRYVIEVMLTSPNFLYRVEIGDSPEGLSNLTAREIASRLSFAAWGRAPNQELLTQADQGVLDTPDGLHQVANSMLQDPRAEVFYTTFFREWLNYDEMRPPNEPPADWNEALMASMQQETDTFLARFAWTPNTDFFGALTANHSFLSPELATFYGLSTPATDGRVDFPAGHPRENAGLLAHASVLSAKSDGDSVALRGNWLRSTFLCESLHIDAAQLDAIGEELVGLTRMQIIAERNSRPQCANCHSAIDPIGVGFEQFDATGRFDASVDLSAYPVAPGFPDAADPSFESLPQLAQKLAELPAVAACLSSRTFLYTHGRDPVQQDSCAVEQATTRFLNTQRAFSSLLLGLVDAPAFRLRRAPTL